MKFLAHAATGVAIAVSLAPALAADLPTHKDAFAAPPPVSESPWGGFYLGGFAGGSFASAAQGYSVTADPLAIPAVVIPIVNDAGAQGLRLRGADLGVQGGYDWRIASTLLLGVAGDINWSGLTGGRSADGFLVPAFAPLLPFSITQKLSNDWRGSLRLRAGVTPLDNLLVYATGGFAVGHFNYKTTFWDRLDPPIYLPGTETENASFSATRVGWTLGGGAEWAVSRNWSVGGEYRYSQFAAITGTGAIPIVQPFPTTAFVQHSAGPIRLNSLRLGVNYHFN